MTQYFSQSRRFGDLARVYESIARVLLYLAIFLIPITYFPWTIDVLEVNKQTVLLFCVALSAIAWLGSMVVKKECQIKRTSTFAIVGLLLLAVLGSSFGSIAPYTSWIGQSGQEYTSFVSILAFGLFFIIGAHLLADTKSQKMVWGLSLVSSALVGFIASLEVFGLTVLATNQIGTPGALGLYLATMAVISCGLFLVTKDANEFEVFTKNWFGFVVRISALITIISAVIVLFALDYWVMWTALIVGISVLFLFALLKAQEFPHISRFVLPMILFVISILFLFLPTFANNVYPGEVAPSYSASWRIAKESLTDHSSWLGSGPGTFVMDYTKYKSGAVNSSELWDVRFDRASSHIATLLATFGIIGTLLVLLLMMTIIGLSLAMLIRNQPHDEWKMTFVAFAGWLMLAFAQFLYSSNFTISFIFWLLSAILISQTAGKIRHLTFSQSPRAGLATVFVFVLINISMLTLIFVTGSRYASEITFARAVVADSTDQDLDIVLLDLESAARLNRLSDVYARNLGNAYLLKTAELLEDENTDPSAISAFISASISEASRAVDLSPANVVNWALLGDIYREFSPLITGADQYAISSYQKTVELAPSNPKYYVALARAYIASADQLNVLIAGEDEVIQEQARVEYALALENAVDALEYALQLKSEYTPAHYYLALAYERQGNLSDAISRMVAVSTVNPYDVGVSLQLGILYLKQGKTDLAEVEFKRALEIAPNFANARWYLASVYEQDNNIEDAIEQIELLLANDPENSLVQQKLERLQEGLVEEEVPEPLESDDGIIIE